MAILAHHFTERFHIRFRQLRNIRPFVSPNVRINVTSTQRQSAQFIRMGRCRFAGLNLTQQIQSIERERGHTPTRSSALQ